MKWDIMRFLKRSTSFTPIFLVFTSRTQIFSTRIVDRFIFGVGLR